MTDYKEKFHQLHPGVIYLENEINPALLDYLRRKLWIGKTEEIIKLEKPGEGNMNFVVRVISDTRRFILKQARPWVQKYPQVAAPIDRAGTEFNFYALIAQDDFLKRHTPQLIGYDPQQYILALEDLGEGADFTKLYQKGENLTSAELEALTGFLSQLHALDAKPETIRKVGHPNMKKLNHEHIFIFPFLEENGFDLDTVQPGLQTAALPFKKNKTLKNKIIELGEIYLATHQTLIQGDYYPGSWLKVESGLKIIDPEFAYFGRAEFELGVMVAHFKMSQQEEDTIQHCLRLYQKPAGFEDNLFRAFIGIELLRRLVGLAQLPLSLHLQEKMALMDEAKTYIENY
ncbi:MAG: phosphotransferase [Microscillaceae bacterium]|nr:phosphotransferase [Microscillaceae bacterium]